MTRRPSERAFLFVVASLAASTYAQAAPSRSLRDVPCKGCLVELPPDAAGTPPLVVVLHGDDGSAIAALAPWKAAARSKGAVLFAPSCPKDQGCTGSWWRWNGPVSWLTEQIDELAKTVPIDTKRVVLAGWSGGASWMGLKGGELSPRFSGLAIEGGGIPPTTTTCPVCLPPVHVLAGDKNPLHHLEVATKDWFARCGAEVVWEPLPGKDHAGEAAVLARPDTTLRVLELLLAAPGPCAPPAPPVASASAVAPQPASDPPPPSVVPVTPPPPAATAAAPPPAPHCGCEAAGHARRWHPWVAALFGVALARRRRRQRVNEAS